MFIFYVDLFLLGIVLTLLILLLVVFDENYVNSYLITIFK